MVKLGINFALGIILAFWVPSIFFEKYAIFLQLLREQLYQQAERHPVFALFMTGVCIVFIIAGLILDSFKKKQ